jgi:hypothetical protein
MAARERVLLLLDAVRRVVIELPVIEAETLRLLEAESVNGAEWSPVYGAVFEPEEGSRRRRDRRTTIGNRIVGEDIDRISELFAIVREEAEHE